MSYRSGQEEIQNQGKKEEYRYFLPSLINQKKFHFQEKIVTSLEETVRLLGTLNAYGDLIPDVDFFIKMHINFEAITSSRIEGIQTNMEEILLPKEEIDSEKRNDWREVKSYILAMGKGIEQLKDLPVSIRLITEIHKTLLSNVRGKHKMPGEVRRSQNWIGGSKLNNAHFIPPHHQHLRELLSDWEKFWHNPNLELPILIKIAICHYQFETIHPFLDGNGRVGRLIIILQLIEKEFLKHPILYISNFFEKNRIDYYDSLDRVRKTNNLDQWILFFLEGIKSTSEKSKKTLEKILELNEEFQRRILTLGKKIKNAKQALNYLYTDPFITVSILQKQLGVSYQSTNNLIKDFERLEILKRTKSPFLKKRFFLMREYVSLFD